MLELCNYLYKSKPDLTVTLFSITNFQIGQCFPAKPFEYYILSASDQGLFVVHRQIDKPFSLN